jgi:hypothetical protein
MSGPSDPADKVWAFYESHPYPAPLSNLDRHRVLYRNPDSRRAASHLLWPTRKPRPDRKILIAGCGTSQAVIHAMREPDAQVVGNTKAPKPLMTLPEPRRSAPARAICLRLLELLVLLHGDYDSLSEGLG